MKKKYIIIISIMLALLLIFLAYFIGSGFYKEGSVYIDKYSISPDQTEMTIDISVASSIGYVRKVSVNQQSGGILYLDCYSAFGGINGSIGAKGQYTIRLDESIDTIALYRSAGCYDAVLQKDSNGEWQRVQ